MAPLSYYRNLFIDHSFTGYETQALGSEFNQVELLSDWKKYPMTLYGFLEKDEEQTAYKSFKLFAGRHNYCLLVDLGFDELFSLIKTEKPFFEPFYKLEVSKDGCFKIPQRVIVELGIKDEVVMTGLASYFKITADHDEEEFDFSAALSDLD